MYTVHLTPKSKNAKTGPIPVSTTTAATCPASCPFNNANEGGCYAGSGPLALHWNKVTAGERGDDWSTFCNKIADLPEGQLWRHNQAGDLPGDGTRIDSARLGDLVAANHGKRGFTYTHYDVTSDSVEAAGNQGAIDMANRFGFTVNVSANSPAHADQLADLDVAPVVTVLPASDEGKRTVTTPAGRKVAVCPATYRDDVSCASCQLCQRRDRKVIVGFPAHGTGKKRASRVAENNSGVS